MKSMVIFTGIRKSTYNITYKIVRIIIYNKFIEYVKWRVTFTSGIRLAVRSSRPFNNFNICVFLTLYGFKVWLVTCSIKHRNSLHHNCLKTTDDKQWFQCHNQRYWYYFHNAFSTKLLENEWLMHMNSTHTHSPSLKRNFFVIFSSIKHW